MPLPGAQTLLETLFLLLVQQSHLLGLLPVTLQRAPGAECDSAP